MREVHLAVQESGPYERDDGVAAASVQKQTPCPR